MYLHSVSMLEFHTFCILLQSPRHGEYFYLMKPLIKFCEFTSNCLTFRLTPDIRTLMPKFVTVILCFENRPSFNIVTLSSCPCSPSRHIAVVCVAPICEFTASNFKNQEFK